MKKGGGKTQGASGIKALLAGQVQQLLYGRYTTPLFIAALK
jgi:hypothetical protein